MKIIAFPFAGGNKYSFNNFFPINYNTTILEYPGRGLRNKEDLIENINELVSNLLPQVKKEINSYNEYIIFGHSMGALVGYLICMEIEKLGLKLPVILVVSGTKSPRFYREKIVSNLPNKAFWEEVSKLGGIPEELNNHPELIEYFTPILKADFRCIENYRYNKESPKLTIPIDVFYGSDEEITQEQAEAWQEETTTNVNVKKLKGNHFFIFDHKKFVKEYLKKLQLNATI